MSFDVLGDCMITVVAQSSSSEERNLILIDKYGCPVEIITIDGDLGYYNIQYTGDENTLYIWSLDSTARVYAVAKTPSGGAYSLRNNENEDLVTSGSAIEIDNNF